MMYIVAIIVIIFLVALSRQKEEETDTPTGFGNISDHLSIWNYGFSLLGGRRATTRDQAYRNALIVGTTGSGKTAATLIGSLFTLSRRPSSIIVLDVSGEIKELTSGYLHTKKKRKIFSFDLTGNSDGFNPLQMCKTVDDLNKVAHVLLKNGDVVSKSDPYWSSASEMVISLFMQYLMSHASKEHQNMTNVVLLLETFMSEPQKIDRLFVKARNENLMRQYRSLNATPEKQRLSILATAISALKLFKSPAVARCTAVSTFDVASFREVSSILYLCIPLNLVNFLAPLTAVMFEMLFQEALSRIPNDDEIDLFFLIDEMITMKLDLGLVYSNCRKYRVGCMGLIQDKKMLEMKYSVPESYAIMSNSCSQVYLPPQSPATCKELQDILGKYTVEAEDGRERQEHLMEASEIRTMKEALVLINGELPLCEKIHPYYDHFLYSGRTKIHPYTCDRKIPFDTPPLIQFD